jgi:UDP-2,3-diacylglucosamine pyrophosphatase LpxH
MLNFAQTEIFRMLLKHIIKEKIEFATVLKLSLKKSPVGGSKENYEKNKVKDSKQLPSVKESVESNENEVRNINGVIEGETEKALLIQFENNKEIWIPKSVIRSNYNSVNDITQNFIIDDWILKKNNVIQT